MKKFGFFMVWFLLFSLGSQAQGLQRFFDKYANDERFSYSKMEGSTQTLSLELDRSNRAIADALTREVLSILKRENYNSTVESRNKREFSYIYNNNNGETVILNRDDNDWDLLWTKPGKKKQYRIYGDLYQNYNYSIDSTTIKNLQRLGKMKFPEINWKKFEKLKNMKFPVDIEYTLNDAEQQLKLAEKQLNLIQ